MTLAALGMTPGLAWGSQHNEERAMSGANTTLPALAPWFIDSELVHFAHDSSIGFFYFPRVVPALEYGSRKDDQRDTVLG